MPRGSGAFDWASYSVIRFQVFLKSRSFLINRRNCSHGGAAETPIVVVPAAIANADFFDATGVRLREVLFTPERLLSGLRAKAAALPRA